MRTSIDALFRRTDALFLRVATLSKDKGTHIARVILCNVEGVPQPAQTIKPGTRYLKRICIGSGDYDNR